MLPGSPSGFDLALEEFLGRRGWPTGMSVFDLVERWEQFIRDVVDCYDGNWYEYSNDTSLRTLLSDAFVDEDLRHAEQMGIARARVRVADEKLRAVLRTDFQTSSMTDLPWWKQGILGRAGDEYADDMERLFSVKIDRCS